MDDPAIYELPQTTTHIPRAHPHPLAQDIPQHVQVTKSEKYYIHNSGAQSGHHCGLAVAETFDLRLWVQIPSHMPAIFQQGILCQVIVICINSCKNLYLKSYFNLLHLFSHSSGLGKCPSTPLKAP